MVAVADVRCDRFFREFPEAFDEPVLRFLASVGPVVHIPGYDQSVHSLFDAE